MTQPLKPKPLMSLVLPGLLFIFLLIIPYFILNPDTLFCVGKLSGSLIAAIGVLIFFAAWIVGNLCDATRNILDNIFHQNEPLWDFLFLGPEKRVDRLVDFYYEYYRLDRNFLISIVLAIFFEVLFWAPSIYWGLIEYHTSTISYLMFPLIHLFLAIAFWVFRRDARDLMAEMNDLVDRDD